MSIINRERSAGVALVFVLFVVALVAVLTTTLISSQFVQIRRLENSISLAQSLQHAYGIEAWGLEVLKRDQLDSKVDHLQENWNTPLQPVKIDAVTQLAGWMSDESALYDVNKLVSKGKALSPEVTRFKNLISQLEVEPGVVDSIVDWMDRDTQTQAAGAEDPYYMGLQPAYVAANKPLSHLSEIAYIKNIDAGTLSQLQPLATTLPESTPVNINTAPAQILVLAIPGLASGAADSLIQQREESPFEDIASFMAYLQSSAGFSEAAVKGINQTSLSVSSRYFLVTSEVSFNDNVLQMRSRIYRDPKGGLRVYERDIQFLQ